ncbi:hypothetical protein [Sporosarcina trichiuri]|uniref:hypothetical protein n=1 Tax=Sporosarcina trichiuri TaxID=3056445 RepID=UPI0025B5E0DF|nr:hypothetical protein [Sporosarcina sp. 0.2-SM1T-5]WJY26384.1 hypothetical protein QWT68_09835 [Sporosarcina sp. 0.2-SM1T-5]
MKINFTKKQYKQLLDLVYLGEWTANSAKEEDERHIGYEELFQYICSFAKDFGSEDFVVSDKAMARYFLTREYEEQLEPIIQENDNEVFWNELAGRLARRDLARTQNVFASEGDATAKYFETAGNYEIEFENNGLENLELRKP